MFQTSVFTPAHGTVTSVRVTSLVPAPEVIKLLLDKFKVSLQFTSLSSGNVTTWSYVYLRTKILKSAEVEMY